MESLGLWIRLLPSRNMCLGLVALLGFVEVTCVYIRELCNVGFRRRTKKSTDLVWIFLGLGSEIDDLFMILFVEKCNLHIKIRGLILSS